MPVAAIGVASNMWVINNTGSHQKVGDLGSPPCRLLRRSKQTLIMMASMPPIIQTHWKTSVHITARIPPFNNHTTQSVLYSLLLGY